MSPIRLCHLLLLVPAFLSAQTYLWPTSASKYLASSFCEYRPQHYHAAIDIKTWNKEGYPCFAVENGKIHRIKLSEHGAGKALYLKLNDGRFAVYFHLQKFPDKIEKELRKLQLEQKKYGVEWWPSNWPVTKGETVAYSGQTGIGVPHLHFEIRDNDNIPINPIPFFKDDIKDNIAPRLSKLLVIPRDKNSSVGGSFMPADYNLKYIRDGVYIVDEPIYGHGNIGLAINGIDQANDVNNKLGFYSSQLSLDGKKVFEYAYDRISFSQTRLVDIDIYYPEKVRTGTRYNKLYLEPFNSLGFYNRQAGDGLLHVSAEEINFEVEIRDFFGNKSLVKGSVMPYRRESVQMSPATTIEGSAIFDLFIPDSLKSIEFFSSPDKSEQSKISYFEILDRKSVAGGNQTLIKVNLPSAEINNIFSSIEDTQGNIYNSDIEVSNLMPQKTTIDKKLMGEHLLFSFPRLETQDDIKVEIIQGDIVNEFILNANLELVLHAEDVISDSLRMRVVNNNTVVADSVFMLNVMSPGKGREFSFSEGNFAITTSGSSAYDDLFFDVAVKPFIDSTLHLPFMGKAIYLESGGHILNNSMTLSIKPDSNFRAVEKAAIYSVDGDDYEYEGGSPNSQNGMISTRTRSFGIFVIIADTVQPLIEMIYPQKNEYAGLTSISFKTVDNLSGIGDSENIEIYFDDQYIVPEWDPERDLVTGNLHFTPSKGPHSIKISVKDRVGNSAQKDIPMVIK